MKSSISILAGGFLLLCSYSYGSELIGEVIGVSDGDTITVLHTNKTKLKARLSDIDAPEKKQAYGKKAKKALSEKI